MRSLFVLAVAPVIVASNLSVPAAAEWYETRVTRTQEDSRKPRVTFDVGDDLHVLWEEAGEIRHRLYTDTGWEEVETVGTGSGFDHWMCLS